MVYRMVRLGHTNEEIEQIIIECSDETNTAKRLKRFRSSGVQKNAEAIRGKKKQLPVVADDPIVVEKEQRPILTLKKVVKPPIECFNISLF